MTLTFSQCNGFSFTSSFLAAGSSSPMADTSTILPLDVLLGTGGGFDDDADPLVFGGAGGGGAGPFLPGTGGGAGGAAGPFLDGTGGGGGGGVGPFLVRTGIGGGGGSAWKSASVGGGGLELSNLAF